VACRRCTERGKTWEGGDPRCAFEGPQFSSDNWNCATMVLVRFIASDHGMAVPCGDSTTAVLPMSDGGECLVLAWYKRRGRTGTALVVTEDEARPATLAEVDDAIATLAMKFQRQAEAARAWTK